MSSVEKAGWTLAVTGGFILIGTLANTGTTKEAYEDGVLQFYPDYMRERLSSTYGHVISGLGITATSAVLAFRSGVLNRIMIKHPITYVVATLVGSIGAMVATFNFSLEEQPVAKYIAWGAFNGIMGTSLSYLGVVGSPIIINAAVSTAVMVGAISMIAGNAPSDEFLW